MHRCNGASNKRTGKSRSYSGTSNGQHGSSGSSSGLSCCVIFTLFVPVGFLWLPADSDWPPPVASYYVDIRDEASCVRCFNQHTVHAHGCRQWLQSKVTNNSSGLQSDLYTSLVRLLCMGRQNLYTYISTAWCGSDVIIAPLLLNGFW